MGVEYSLSAALSVRQPADDHGLGARHRLPRHRHGSGQKGGLQEKDGSHRRGCAYDVDECSDKWCPSIILN